MEQGTAIAIVAAAASNALAFGIVLLKIGRITERIDLVWEWYLDEHRLSPRPDRRRHDKPA